MSISSIAVRYEDTATGIISTEVTTVREMHCFFEDETLGLIQILEVNQSFDGWETMETLYRVS